VRCAPAHYTPMHCCHPVPTLPRPLAPPLLSLAKAFKLEPRQTRRLVNHADNFWRLVSGISDNKILSQLPTQLRAEILKDIHADTMHFSTFLSKLSRECVIQCLAKFQTELILERETFIALGQNLDKVYMLLRGTLMVTAPSSPDGAASDRSRKSARMSGRSSSSSPLPVEGAPTGGKKIPKAFQDGAGSDSPEGSRTSTRRSSIKKMGGRDGMLQMLERPGSMLGGGRIFERTADIYPFDVTVSRKTTVLSIKVGMRI
jgi:hypothetical protein